MNYRDVPSLRRRVLVRHHPSAFLLAVQLVMLLLYAAFDGVHSGRALLGALSALVVALALWVVIRSPAINWVAWVIAAPTFAIDPFRVFPRSLAWSSVLEATVYFYTAGSLIAYMMQDYRVTPDELFAAGATFTLIAWGFAYAFLVCQMWFRDSFVGGTRPGEPRTFIELLFLSFTNLSAVGVGDILPIGSRGTGTGHARTVRRCRLHRGGGLSPDRPDNHSRRT